MALLSRNQSTERDRFAPSVKVRGESKDERRSGGAAMNYLLLTKMKKVYGDHLSPEAITALLDCTETECGET